MKAFEKNRGLIEEFANAQHTYLIDGHTPSQGEVFRNPDLANTLSMIAKGGRDEFYKGKIAHTMADYFQRIGGDLRYSDFADFHGEWVQPESVDYRGYDVYELPPNGQGFATLEMLNILKGFDLKKMGVGSADALTAEIEAKRLAYADLAKYYADPRFYNAPIKGLLSDQYADQRRKLIDLNHANPDIGPGDPRLFNGDTTDFETADDSGMMVSMIQSNYAGMGSGLVADGLGFMFQDRGALYSLHRRCCQRVRASQAPVPHHHPGLRDEGRPALAGIRRDGRRHAAARPCAGAGQHDRLRHERTGSRRCRPLAALRRRHTDRTAVGGHRHGGDGDGLRSGREGGTGQTRVQDRAGHRRFRRL